MQGDPTFLDPSGAALNIEPWERPAAAQRLVNQPVIIPVQVLAAVYSPPVTRPHAAKSRPTPRIVKEFMTPRGSLRTPRINQSSQSSRSFDNGGRSWLSTAGSTKLPSVDSSSRTCTRGSKSQEPRGRPHPVYLPSL